MSDDSSQLHRQSGGGGTKEFLDVGNAHENLDAATQALTFSEGQGAGAPETSLASVQGVQSRWR